LRGEGIATNSTISPSTNETGLFCYQNRFPSLTACTIEFTRKTAISSEHVRVWLRNSVVAPILRSAARAHDAVLVRPVNGDEAEAEHISHLHVAQHAAAVAAQAVDRAAAYHVPLLVASKAEKHRAGLIRRLEPKHCARARAHTTSLAGICTPWNVNRYARRAILQKVPNN
jgi:hypothetical protein